MAPRSEMKSLKHVAQRCLVLAITAKTECADVLKDKSTHVAVSVMKQVVEELEDRHRRNEVKSKAIIKQKQCQLEVAERQLADVSRAFKNIWRVVVGDDTYLEVLEGGNGRCMLRRQESQKSGYRLIHVEISRAGNPPQNEPVNTWGIENWTFYHRREAGRFPDTRFDYIAGQNLYDGRIGRKVTDPFL